MNELNEWDESFIERLIDLLNRDEDKILNIWLQKAKLSPNDPYYTEIIVNGRQTIRLIKDYLKDKNINKIVNLTKKIAMERIEANVNISEFAHNINVGRSIVNRVISESNLEDQDKIQGLTLVDQLFDTYLYNAVKEYTNIKDSIIFQKNQFIQEMHNDRLSILGQLSASFAHEFRNPLTSIKGFISLLERKYSEDEESAYFFSIINQEMESLQKNVSQFLYLSKTKGLDDEMKSFDLSLLVKNVTDFLYPRFVDENIQVDTSIQPSCLLLGVEEQLKQVVLNILLNAVEELSERSANRLIQVRLFKEDDHIHIELSNNGPTIPKHMLNNIFEPFVTTKDLGVGLGLSVCKQIIEKHEGTIQVNSDEDYTTFYIKL